MIDSVSDVGLGVVGVFELCDEEVQLTSGLSSAEHDVPEGLVL